MKYCFCFLKLFLICLIVLCFLQLSYLLYPSGHSLRCSSVFSYFLPFSWFQLFWRLCSVINSVFSWLLDISLWIASIAWNVSSLKLNLPFLPSDLLLCVRGTVSSLSQSLGVPVDSWAEPFPQPSSVVRSICLICWNNLLAWFLQLQSPLFTVLCLVCSQIFLRLRF